MSRRAAGMEGAGRADYEPPAAGMEGAGRADYEPPADPQPAPSPPVLDAEGWRVWLREGWLMLPPSLRRVAHLKVADGGTRHRVYISTHPLDQPDEFLLAVALLNLALVRARRPFVTWSLIDLLRDVSNYAAAPDALQLLGPEALRICTESGQWVATLRAILPPRELP